MSASFRKWDIVLLSYPFTDLSARKVRPAVVVSPDSENCVLEDAVFLLITSNTARLSQFDLIVDITHPEFAATGLLNQSAIRVNKVWTLHNTLVRRTLGRLGPRLQQEIANLLASYFDISHVSRDSAKRGPRMKPGH